MASRDEIIRYVYEVTGQRDLANAAKVLLDTGASSEEAAEHVSALAKEFQDLAQQSGALKNFTRDKAALAEVTAQLNKAKAGLAALNAEFSESDKSSARVSRAFTAAERSIAQLSGEQNRLSAQFAKSQGTLEKAGLDTANLSKAQQDLAKRSGEAAAKVGDLAKQTERGGRFAAALTAATQAGARGFQGLRDAINSVGSGLLKVTGLAGAVSTALGAISIGRIFGGAVSSAREFGAVLSEVQAVSGATAEQLAQLKASAESVSATTKFSATEAAQGLGELARATGSAEAAMAALPATMQLAQAAGYGVAESATLVTTTLTQFGLAVDQAGRVSDVLAKAANSTSADVQGLGNALSYAAPLAKQLNLTFEETTAIIGALADQGFRGERAGTALRNVFSELMDPASQFKQALLALGIQTDSFSGIMEGLAAAGDRGRDAIMLLDAQARPAILSLVSSGGAAIRSLESDLGHAGGAAAETAKIMGDNFESAWQRISNAVDQMRRDLVAPVLDALAVEVDAVALRIREFVKTADFEGIKTAIRDFAVSGVQSLKAFASSIDFSALAGSIKGFAESATSALKSMSESAGAIGQSLSVIGNTISLFWNGLQTIILTGAGVITGGFAAIVKGALIAAEGLANLNGSSAALKPTFDAIHESMNGLVAVSNEFSKRAEKNARETGAAWDGLSASMAGTAAAAEAAAPAIGELGGDVRVTAEQAENLKAQFAVLPEYLQRIVAPGLQAAGVMVQVGNASAKVAQETARTSDTLGDAQQRLAAAVSAYSDLARSGTATADELQRAGVAVAQATGQVDRLSASATSGARSADALKAAFATLGISSQEDLQNAADAAALAFDQIAREVQAGTKPVEDLRAAFEQYAAAQLAAVKNSDTWKQSTIRDMLEVKAAALGLTDVKLPEFKPSTEGWRSYRSEIQAGSQAQQEFIDTSTTASRAIEATAAATDAARGTMAGFTIQVQGWGEKAIETFNRVQDAALLFLKEDTGGAGLRQYIAAVNSGMRDLNETIARQQRDALQYMESSRAMTEEQIANLANQQGGYERLIAETQAATANMDMLDAQTLSSVQAAADALAQKVDSVRQKTEAAAQAFVDYAASARDQIDQINGDQDSAEDRRFQRELERLKKQAEESNALSTAEYNEAVAAARQLHALKMEQIREQEEAKAKADAESAAREAEAERRKREQSTNEPADSNTTTTTRNEQTINIKLDGKEMASLENMNDGQITSLARRLLPEIIRQLQSWRGR